MARRVLFHHPSSLLHDPGSHPEQPARMVAVEQVLEARGWLGFERRPSPEVTRGQLRAVHSDVLVHGVEDLCAAGGGSIDLDTIVSRGSWEAAVRAAGGAVGVVDALMTERARVAVSLHRPPGHHAEIDRAMGFCLFNNVAVAARHARDAHGLARVAVVDFDVHHGNGTQDIFYATDEVLFCSIHQRPLFPGTGAATEVGAGAGQGYTVNLPVAPGAGDGEFTSLMEHVVVPMLAAYRPQLLLISAGFDAHADDPLGNCRVSDRGYATMATSLRAAADALGVPVGMVLEGGYDLGALSRGVAGTLEALAAEGPVTAPAVPLAAGAEEARRRWVAAG